MTLIEYLEPALENAGDLVDLIGVAILLMTAAKFLVHYVIYELRRLRGIESVIGIRNLRLRLGAYILLALEFMIISDVIHTALSRDLDSILYLAMLVVVRTALGFFLALDLKDIRAEAGNR